MWDPNRDPETLPDEIAYAIDYMNDENDFRRCSECHPNGLQFCSVYIGNIRVGLSLIQILHQCLGYKKEDDPYDASKSDTCRHAWSLGDYSVCERQVTGNMLELFVKGTVIKEQIKKEQLEDESKRV